MLVVFILEGVLHIASRVVRSALGLVELAFGLHLVVAGQAADCIFHRPLRLIGRAFDVLFVHVELLCVPPDRTTDEPRQSFGPERPLSLTRLVPDVASPTRRAAKLSFACRYWGLRATTQLKLMRAPVGVRILGVAISRVSGASCWLSEHACRKSLTVASRLS